MREWWLPQVIEREAGLVITDRHSLHQRLVELQKLTVFTRDSNRGTMIPTKDRYVSIGGNITRYCPSRLASVCDWDNPPSPQQLGAQNSREGGGGGPRDMP